VEGPVTGERIELPELRLGIGGFHQIADCSILSAEPIGAQDADRKFVSGDRRARTGADRRVP
jgi:hypothetical protein